MAGEKGTSLVFCEKDCQKW